MPGTFAEELTFLEDAVNQAYFNAVLLNILLLGMFLTLYHNQSVVNTYSL